MMRYLLLVLLLALSAVADKGADRTLLRAAFSNSYEGVKAALAYGADVNAQDEQSGQTALMGAVLRGYTNIVKYLLSLDDKIDIMVPEKDGYTPAHGAGFQGRAEIMRLLLQAGVNVHDDFAHDGYAPLHRACWGREPRHTETIKFLMEEAGVNPHTLTSKSGQTCAEMTRNPGTLALLNDDTKEEMTDETNEEINGETKEEL